MDEVRSTVVHVDVLDTRLGVERDQGRRCLPRIEDRGSGSYHREAMLRMKKIGTAELERARRRVKA